MGAASLPLALTNARLAAPRCRPTGFCLCFPSAASPQLELFNGEEARQHAWGTPWLLWGATCAECRAHASTMPALPTTFTPGCQGTGILLASMWPALLPPSPSLAFPALPKSLARRPLPSGPPAPAPTPQPPTHTNPHPVAIRVFASAVGPAALHQPTVELSPGARPPLPRSPFATLEEELCLPMDLEFEAAGLEEGGGGGGGAWGMPVPLAAAVPAVVAVRPCLPGADTPRHCAPPPTPAAAQQAAAAAADEWPSLQALLLAEQEPQLVGVGGGPAAGGTDGSPAAGSSDAGEQGPTAVFYARSVTDPLERFCLADNLSLSCSLGPSDALFDASCLDFLCAETR